MSMPKLEIEALSIKCMIATSQGTFKHCTKDLYMKYVHVLNVRSMETATHTEKLI